MINELRVRAFKMPKEKDGRFIFWDNPEISAFFYALSVTLPVTEELMIKSCRDFMDDVEDESFKKQLRWYIGQEAHHTKAHIELNKWIESLGVDIESITSKFREELKDVYSMDRKARLAYATGLEHLTTIICRHLLYNAKKYDDVPSFCRDLILWHAYEEMEHKAVLYDLYEKVGIDHKVKRQTYLKGSKITMAAGLEYSELVMEMMGVKPTFSQKVAGFRYFYGFKGLMTSCIFGFFSYMRKKFHPNNIDDSALIDHWEEKNTHIEFDLRSKTICD